jgi:hypothetical protein
VTVTGKSVEIHYTDAWKNGRTLFDDDGGIISSSQQDDIAKIVVACTPGGDRMRCTRTELSRVCHIDTDVVDCKSF